MAAIRPPVTVKLMTESSCPSGVLTRPAKLATAATIRPAQVNGMHAAAGQLAAGDSWPSGAAPDLLECAEAARQTAPTLMAVRPTEVGAASRIERAAASG